MARDFVRAQRELAEYTGTGIAEAVSSSAACCERFSYTMTEPTASDTAMAAATATAMYLVLKLTMLTKSRYFLFSGNLTRGFPARATLSRGKRRNVDLFRRKRGPTFH